jgi:hypothetical protein
MISETEARRLDNEGNGHFQKIPYAPAAEKYRLAVKRDPENAPAHNNLAWLLLTAPEPFRNAREALPLALPSDSCDPGALVVQLLDFSPSGG